MQSLLGGSKIYSKLIGSASASSRRSRVAQLVQIPVMIALALAVVGGMDETDKDQKDINSGKQYTKIAVVLFTFIYILLSCLVIITIKDVRRAVRGEKRIFFAVLAALPLLAIRILYSILAAFSHWKAFSLMDGNTYVQLIMATLTELVIVIMYTLAGLTVEKGSNREKTQPPPGLISSYAPANNARNSRNEYQSHYAPGNGYAPTNQNPQGQYPQAQGNVYPQRAYSPPGHVQEYRNNGRS